MAVKTVKLVANSNNKTLPTVNVTTTKRPNNTTYAQQSGVVGKNIPTYQDSGGTVVGLKTIHIPGYVGPA